MSNGNSNQTTQNQIYDLAMELIFRRLQKKKTSYPLYYHFSLLKQYETPNSKIWHEFYVEGNAFWTRLYPFMQVIPSSKIFDTTLKETTKKVPATTQIQKCENLINTNFYLSKDEPKTLRCIIKNKLPEPLNTNFILLKDEPKTLRRKIKNEIPEPLNTNFNLSKDEPKTLRRKIKNKIPEPLNANFILSKDEPKTLRCIIKNKIPEPLNTNFYLSKDELKTLRRISKNKIPEPLNTNFYLSKDELKTLRRISKNKIPEPLNTNFILSKDELKTLRCIIKNEILESLKSEIHNCPTEEALIKWEFYNTFLTYTLRICKDFNQKPFELIITPIFLDTES